ncbi:hypothetical protein D3C72_88110 [compost metagenome]
MHKLLLSLPLLMAVHMGAHAAENKMQLKPGLWEMSATNDLLNLVEQIPPEQMKNLSNLAKQYGFDMPKIQNGAATSKVCITPQMAAQDIPPSAYHRQSGCEARNATRVDNRYSADLVCASDQVNGQGKTEATLNTPESFSGKTSFKGLVRGVQVDESANTSGRWLAASCPVGKSAP